LRIYMENAPNMKDRRRDLKKAELSLDLAHKNRLPLPKVAFSGISLNYNNVYNTITPTFASSAYNANMNISGSVSLSLPLVGPGGLFNNRVIEQTQIALDQANLAFLNTTNQDELSIVQGIRTVLQSENNVKNNSEAFEKSLSILEKLSENLTSGTINRLELRDAINNSRNYELNLEDSKVQHLQSKMDLAQLIGVDKLPGDPYP